MAAGVLWLPLPHHTDDVAHALLLRRRISMREGREIREASQHERA